MSALAMAWRRTEGEAWSWRQKGRRMTTIVARMSARARPRKSRMVSFMSELVNRKPSGGIER